MTEDSRHLFHVQLAVRIRKSREIGPCMALPMNETSTTFSLCMSFMPMGLPHMFARLGCAQGPPYACKDIGCTCHFCTSFISSVHCSGIRCQQAVDASCCSRQWSARAVCNRGSACHSLLHRALCRGECSQDY